MIYCSKKPIFRFLDFYELPPLFTEDFEFFFHAREDSSERLEALDNGIDLLLVLRHDAEHIHNEILVDAEDPSKGFRRQAAYEYSLGRGIEDGFLATYKVHRVRTTVDQNGLKLQEAVEQGAEVFIPEDAATRELYTTPQFEREITVPDRTKVMVDHLAGLLRKFGPTEKTMVFCVDIPHAQLVARLLNDSLIP